MIVEDYGFGLCIKDIQSWVKKAIRHILCG